MKLSVVLVTYNRLEKLKKTLNLYMNQTISNKGEKYRLIIVNNCSTDGTTEYLKDWEVNVETPFEKVIIHSDKNLGGAGGFYLGEKKALELGSEWVFVADDDAYPSDDMIEKFFDYIANHDCKNLSTICAVVHEMDGSVAQYHRNFFKTKGFKYKQFQFPIENLKKESFEIDLLSYVGSFIKAEALNKVGLIESKYFIYFDDSEHSLRLKKFGKIICVPGIDITHEGVIARNDSNAGKITTWREYYILRNELNMIKRHYKLVACYCFASYFRRLYLTRKEKGERRRMMRTAFWDAYFNRLGMHKVYKQGWQIEN